MDAAVVREWIREGRANGQTKVQEEGSADWKTLSECPEFSEAWPAQASAPPGGAAPDPERDPTALLEEYCRRAERLDIWDCVVRSWRLMSEHFWLVAGASAVIFGISVGLELIPVLGMMAGITLSLVLWGGLDWLFLKLIRGQSADLSDAFAGFQIGFLPLLLGGVVSGVLITLGLVLCILPGLYLIVAWMGFSPLLIMEKRMDFWPALELSRRVVTRNFWTILALFMLTLAIVVAGVLALGAGLFVALPLSTGAVVFAYEDIFGAGPPDKT